MAARRAIRRQDGKGAYLRDGGATRATTCAIKCCGGSPPPPNDCPDPVNCFYELSQCNGTHNPIRAYISVRDFALSVGQDAPGACYWAADAPTAPDPSCGTLPCFFIPNPPDRRTIPREEIEPQFLSGAACRVGAVIRGDTQTPPITCCNCGSGITGCTECARALTTSGEIVDGDTPCCCNLQGSCVEVEWALTLTYRATRVGNPDEWVETSYTGSGTWRACYGENIPLPTVQYHALAGPAWPYAVIDGGEFGVNDLFTGFDDTTIPGAQRLATVGGCIRCGYPAAIWRTLGYSLPNASPLPPLVKSCRTLTYAMDQQTSRVEDGVGPGGPADIRQYVIEESLTILHNIRISDGTADCGGGCYDTSALVAVPEGERPLWVGVMSVFRTKGDAGIGDTIDRILGKVGGSVFKRWFKKATGRTCGCGTRAGALNALYPYT